MAEILAPGRLPQDEWYHGTCQNCRCHFKFQKKELKCHSDQRDGTSWTILCPFCSVSCWFNNLEGKKYNPPTVDPY